VRRRLILAVLAWVPSSGSTLEIVISGVMLACLATVGVCSSQGNGVVGWPSAGGMYCSCWQERWR